MKAPTPSNPLPEPGSEETLVARAQSGDAAALDALVVRYQDRVYNMALRMLGNREDALDVAQEIFLTVFKTIRRFQSRARFSTWLYRVTVNRCRDELRRRTSVKHTRPQSLDALRPEEGGAHPLDPEAREAAPPDQVMAREAREMVERAIGKLPEESREVLVLRDAQDLSYDEISAVLDIPLGTVRSRLNRARTLLKESLRPILGVES